jgi:transcription antitermination factor NusG
VGEIVADVIGLEENPAFPCSSLESSWYAIYTSANHEKRVAAELQVRRVEHFLPLYRSVRRWKDRRVQLDVPLFPSYVFVRLPFPHRVQVLQISSVVSLVGFGGKPHPIPTGEVERLRGGIDSGLRIAPHPYLTVGCRVRIKRGPLQGAEGVLVRKKNFYRVVLSIGLISSFASVEVDAADIEWLTRSVSQRAQA